jgi:MOSC domain-containing protein YiiM
MVINELQAIFNKPGMVISIGIRPARQAPMVFVNTVTAIADTGLEGDRYKNKGGSRQVTLIHMEHLDAVASFLGLPTIEHEAVRRNLVISGINLLALKGKRFGVGDAILQYTGECHPCSRMESSLGRGGYNAMRGHGGITARILEGGLIRLQDKVMAIE